MKKWIAKAVVQKVISYLPFSNRINYIFQKYVTKGVYLTDEYFFDRLGHARDHIAAYNKYAAGKELNTSLELGTGWYPVVPVSFYLCGVDKVYTVDIVLLTNKERIRTTLLKFMDSLNSGVLKTYLPYKQERLDALFKLLEIYDSLSFEQIISQLHITYLVEDARTLSLGTQSIDFVNSNNTFEHIYAGILPGILKEFKRVVKLNGVMSHFIDMSDHFAHFDKSITIYNFLQYSDKQWRIIDNTIQPQNRLRITDYKTMYESLDIPITEEHYRAGDLKALDTIVLDKKYKNIPIADIAISHCHFISRM